MSKGKQAEKPFASLLAGATAGGIESFVTFPLESLKTQLQFGSLNGGKVCHRHVTRVPPPYGLRLAVCVLRLRMLIYKPAGIVQTLRQTIAQRGVSGLYAGCTAVVIGNAAKAGVRFTTYDQFKALLRDEEGKLSAPRSMLAGLGAGMMEAVIAVTPSETIK